jgi:DNA replication and repair protein RecF
MINKLVLQNFRNLKKESFQFSPNLTFIIAPNAAGKTNILEAIFMLSTGKSFKAKIEEECINYDSEIARITGNSSLEIVLTRGYLDIGKSAPSRVARKKLTINKISKRLIDFASNLKVVLFAPHDLDLVTDAPTLRRKFLDTVLSQVDREYRRAVLSYDKGLRQRNRLLFRIREENVSRSHLLFWNQLLIKNGNYITDKRQKFIDFVNNTDFKLNINTNYKLEYDRSAISEGRLEQYKNEEIASATTLVGPHRDDFIFKLEEKNLSAYGSRAEQRMGVLWLKLAELSFIERETSEMPTLLLDDIFSELDHLHRKVVMNVIKNYQTIITAADPHFVEEFKNRKKLKLHDKIKIINL